MIENVSFRSSILNMIFKVGDKVKIKRKLFSMGYIGTIVNIHLFKDAYLVKNDKDNAMCYQFTCDIELLETSSPAPLPFSPAALKQLEQSVKYITGKK